MRYSEIASCLMDLVDLITRDKLVEANTKYYDQKAWLPKRKPLPVFVNGKAGKEALQYIKANKCLYAEQVLDMNIGQDISSITWVYSGTEGSALIDTFTVMSVQYWSEGKVVREEYLHAN